MKKDKEPLSITHPEIAKEADGWDPSVILYGSAKKMKWKCGKGHLYESLVQNRTLRRSSCPICVNQKVLQGFNDLATTHPDLAREADGWDPSKYVAGTNKVLAWKCRLGHRWSATGSSRVNGSKCPICVNQKVLQGFNDLATTYPDLAREADGWDPSTVVSGSGKKLNWKCSNGHKWSISPGARAGGSGCPYCRNKVVLKGFNDLATTHPDLAREADGWDPSVILYGSAKKMKWKCQLGHNWSATLDNRVTKKSSCPYCSNKLVLKGFNDLATTHPDLAREADGWDPSTVVSGSGKKLNWKCSNGHKWTTSVLHRSHGKGCPTCATYGFDPNKDAHLYFLIQPTWEIYQIGITNFPKDRLQSHKRNGFELLDLRGPMDGHTAQELETALLRYLKSQKAELSPEHIAGKFDGHSESWTIDSFKVNNLKELIDMATEAGF